MIIMANTSLVSEEIEEGELSSDNEQELSNLNPYEKEDETILQLKIKALQSLLDAETNASGKTTKQEDKKSMQNRKRKNKKKHYQEDDDVEDVMLLDEEEVILLYKNQQNDAIKNRKEKKNNFRIRRKKRKVISNMNKDNYDIEDMDIEVQPQQQPQLSHSDQHYSFANVSPPLLQLPVHPMSYQTNSSSLLMTAAAYPTIRPALMPSSPLISNNISPLSHSQILFNQYQYNQSLISFMSSSQHQRPHPTYMQTNKRAITKKQTRMKPHQQLRPPPSFNLKQIQLNRTNSYTQKKKQIQSPLSLQPAPLMLEKEEKVVFTLSSSSSSTSSPSAALNFDLDVDERFIDKTTSRLDIDYRQGNVATSNSDNNATSNSDDNDLEKSLRILLSDTNQVQQNLLAKILAELNENTNLTINSKILAESSKDVCSSASPLGLITSIESKREEKQKDQEIEKEEEDADKEMRELRMKLLSNLNEKRLLKQKQNEAAAAAQEKQMNADMSLLKKKLIEHEKEMFHINSSNNNSATNQAIIKPSTSAGHMITKPRIKPVIISLNSSDEEDDNEEDELKNNKLKDEEERKNMKLEQNLYAFLNEAKQQALKLATVGAQASSHQETRISPPSSLSLLKKLIPEPLESTEEEKKTLVTSLRDKINAKSVTLSELAKKAIELDKTMLRKEKDLEASRFKCKLLREQMQAAEKVLTANENAHSAVKEQQRLINFKLMKLLNAKKIQQQQLQRLLQQQTNLTNKSLLPPIQHPLSLILSPPVTLQSLTKTKETELPTKSPQPPPLPLPPSPPAPPKITPQTFSESLKQTATIPDVKSLMLSQHQSTMLPTTLGGLAAVAANGTKRANSYSLNRSDGDMTRPNLLTSKSTHLKLEELGNPKFLPMRETDQRVDSEKILDKCLLENHYPYVHCQSLDIWYNEATISKTSIISIPAKDNTIITRDLIGTKLITSENYMQGTKSSSTQSSTDSSFIFPINDVSDYQSPLKIFRGYRFSSHFSQLNLAAAEEAYSKFYCNTIDVRQTFCPYELHGACKDSACPYQHTNVMSMDNYQRTEHFLSYCLPQLMDLTDTVQKKEALKKLRTYARHHMSTHLNKMSIQEYFKHLYEKVLASLRTQIERPYTTILSRATVLCFNNNKSIGNNIINEDVAKMEEDNNETEDDDQLIALFDKILSANMNRYLHVKLTYLHASNSLNVEWLRQQHHQNNHETMNQQELLLAWIFHARQIYIEHSNTLHKPLNVLSNALECNAKNELIWLAYLKVYAMQRNVLFNDFHEVCMLCMDNLVTYDLVWFMLTTLCTTSKTKVYLDLLCNRYEKILLSDHSDTWLTEFEQRQTISIKNKLSFYLCELIFFNVARADHPYELLMSNLHRAELVERIDANDLCFLWLSAIHLKSFVSLPSMVQVANITQNRMEESSSFWRCNSSNKNQRNFNHSFFSHLDMIYTSVVGKSRRRTMDSFLLPFDSRTIVCSVENLETLFYEALKSVHVTAKQASFARVCSVPLFINFIHLEVASKRFQVARKLCDRLLRSPEAESLKELWISQIYINRHNPEEKSQQLMGKLEKIATDAQITIVIAQYYVENNEREKAICLIEKYLANRFCCEKKELIDRFKSNIGSMDLFQDICYCFYAEIKNETFSFETVCSGYETCIDKLAVLQHKAIMWTRYFKFVASSISKSRADMVLFLIEKSIRSMRLSPNDQHNRRRFFIPFYYDNIYDEKDHFYYQNCLVDLWLRLFARTTMDKCTLLRHVLELMPQNTSVLKLLVQHNIKLHGAKHTLQLLYDHLSLNSIGDECMWILCIKLCLDLNDFQQAIQVYEKGQLVCRKHHKSMLALSKLTGLFPS